MFKKKKPFGMLQCAECGKHLRPCLVGDKPAVFHQWSIEDKALLRINAFTTHAEQVRLANRFHDEAIIPECCSVEKIRTTCALVEYEDGSVGKVDPKLVRFLDREGKA